MGDVMGVALAVQRACGGERLTPGCVEIAVWLLGYRRVAEPMPLAAPPVAQPAGPGDLPPPTPSADEIFRRLAGN